MAMHTFGEWVQLISEYTRMPQKVLVSFKGGNKTRENSEKNHHSTDFCACTAAHCTLARINMKLARDQLQYYNKQLQKLLLSGILSP